MVDLLNLLFLNVISNFKIPNKPYVNCLNANSHKTIFTSLDKPPFNQNLFSFLIKSCFPTYRSKGRIDIPMHHTKRTSWTISDRIQL